MIVNEGKDNEVTLRVVMGSDVFGNEYFDGHATLDDALAAVKRLVESTLKQGDGVERIIGIAIVPVSSYGAEDGYGYGLGTPVEHCVTNHNGFAKVHGDNDEINAFIDDTGLGVDDDGFVLNEDDERMTFVDYQRFDVDVL